MEENKDLPVVVIESKRNNYELTIGDYNSTLKRDVDFGMITYVDKKTGETKNVSSKPTLYKSGAEKILLGMGVPYDIEIADSYKDHKEGFYYYEVIAKARDKDGNVIRVGLGCANTNEKNNGTASAFDTANSMLKKAKKRAVVDLAISLASASDWFVQDIEDTTNESRMSNLQSDEDFINSKQIKRIFAIAQSKEITTEQAKTLLVSWGFNSTKEIKVKDYDSICERLENYNKEENK